MLAPSKWLETLQGWIASLGVCSIALLAGIYVLATLFWAPEWPLTIAAGLINALGVPVAVVAETVAASLAFSLCVPLACDSVSAPAAAAANIWGDRRGRLEDRRAATPRPGGAIHFAEIPV